MLDFTSSASIAQYYISLLSGMRNIYDRDHLVGQLTMMGMKCIATSVAKNHFGFTFLSPLQ